MFTFIVSITKLKFVFLVTQVCQSTAWCFEWRPKNSAPIPSLKRPLAGTPTGSIIIIPADMEDKVIEFHRFVLRSSQHWGYDLSRILNMDKMPMQFELPATRTLEFSGSRTVPVLSCGAGVYKMKTEDRRPKTEDRSPKTEDRRPKNKHANFFARIRHGQFKN